MQPLLADAAGEIQWLFAGFPASDGVPPIRHARDTAR